MKLAYNFRAEARRALQGNWGKAIAAAIVGAMLSGGIGFSSGSGVSEEGYLSVADHEAWITMMTISVASLLIAFCIGGAIQLGWSKFNLNMVRNRPAKFRDLFSCFDRLGTGFCMVFLMGLFTFLWSLLLIVPGIIATYRYALTPYLLAEHPEMGVLDAIRESGRLMKGNKWRMFCLDFSFIGWALLVPFTFGIGTLWLTPYVYAAHAAFYEDVAHGQEIP